MLGDDESGSPGGMAKPALRAPPCFDDRRGFGASVSSERQGMAALRLAMPPHTGQVSKNSCTPLPVVAAVSRGVKSEYARHA